MILVNKPISMTPLQVIQQLKTHHSEFTHQTISYAGRLDPMAEGLLLLLVGDENKDRKAYEDMKKTYEFTVLLGIETDTYDVLGIIQMSNQSRLHWDQPSIVSSQQMTDNFSKVLSSFLGKSSQPYPPYSSKTVKGKPLYWWARHGRLQEIELPKREIEIYDISLINESQITKHELRNTVFHRIQNVQGNFRQEEIINSWEHFFYQSENQITRKLNNYRLFNCSITCSSGTYIRGIAHEIGEKLGYGAIALAIKRTAIGDFTLQNAISYKPES